ncbi:MULTISPECIES: hypothetical protein [unclassified Bradyrhizobium]|uniref:hypothetical protein n=1 Tax=unclassified Bradyrhizobium TaxID=2631580 RepID=UPI001CD80DC6|nr:MULTISPECIES: hypothetical protein [unclassified Bradyrhizobium]MCA1398400.1 hypothetical protein [Bradyrhizobium sp. BRP56]UWU92663.1 hypothetical protein N2604_01440 [Bradyrhizobium sp. CB1015]
MLISNELGPSDDADLSDSQLSMIFWVDRDPNSKYEPFIKFDVDAQSFGRLLHTLDLPRRPTNQLHLQIRHGRLTARVTDETGTLWLEGSISLLDALTSDDREFAIVTDRSYLTKLGKLLLGRWSFRLDRASQELSWTNEDYRSQCKAVETALLPTSLLTRRHRIFGKTLSTCLHDATVLRQRRISDERTYHGARIWNGFAMGGHIQGLSQIASNEIPKELDIVVPHSQLANAIHVLRAMNGEAWVDTQNGAVMIENATTRLKGGWSDSDTNLPRELAGAFDRHDPVITLHIRSDLLCSKFTLLGAFSKELQTVRFDVEADSTEDAHAKLSITAVFGALPWNIKISARMEPTTADFADALKNLRFSVSDLDKATSALPASTEVKLQFSARALMLSADHSGIIRRTLLVPSSS